MLDADFKIPSNPDLTESTQTHNVDEAAVMETADDAFYTKWYRIS
jgi:hypothetical protein